MNSSLKHSVVFQNNYGGVEECRAVKVYLAKGFFFGKRFDGINENGQERLAVLWRISLWIFAEA